MIDYLKFIYRRLRSKFRFFISVNWIKTYYFNYKKFPFSIARKLPVFFYGKIKFSSLRGKVIIDAPIKKAMIGYGQSFEFPTTSKGVAEMSLNGIIVFKGNVQIGKDVCLQIADGAYFEMGHFSCLGSGTLVICREKIVLGYYARVGYQTQFIDTTIHQLIDNVTEKKAPMTRPIFLGDENWVGNKTTIMKGTITSNNCIIASNSLLNKDYSELGNNILIGGIPAKLLKENISRDWEGEKNRLNKYLVIN